MKYTLADYIAVDKSTKKTGWDILHNQALTSPRGPEAPIVALLTGLEAYITEYRDRIDSEVFEDYILGTDGIVPIVEGVRVLLNGELGRLDAGTIDGRLVSLLAKFGVEV